MRVLVGLLLLLPLAVSADEQAELPEGAEGYWEIDVEELDPTMFPYSEMDIGMYEEGGNQWVMMVAQFTGTAATNTEVLRLQEPGQCATSWVGINGTTMVELFAVQGTVPESAFAPLTSFQGICT